MSLLMGTRSSMVEREAELRKAETELGRADRRVRMIKIVCAIMLGVCFWYSVPYYLPLKVDPNPQIAAANEAQAYEGNFSRQVAMPIIFAIAAFLLWRLPKRGKIGGKLLIVTLLYVGWAMASFSWADEPAITAKRLVVFGIDAFFAYTIARVFSMMEMALWGFACTGIVGLISLYVDWLQEKIFAPFDPDYRFNGVMTANYQAMNLLVCVVCGLIVLHKKPRWAKWVFPALALALALMYLTRARTGTIVCLILMGIIVTRWMRRDVKPQTRAMVLIGALAVAVPAVIFVLGRDGGDAVQAVFMMGRKDTQNTSNLSNRAPLWAELMESVEDRPWTGFGYSGFWAPARVEKISADQGWMVPHAHNTYLDETLSLGLIGAALYIGMLFGAMVVAWKRYRRSNTEADLLPALLLTWIVLMSLTESIPLDPYLPSMLAYACIVKMCLAEGSEKESDVWLGPEEIVSGLNPKSLEGEPELQALMADGKRAAQAS
ncbi:MAG: O-antigen ligase [Acidobacteriota bacterium]